MVELKKLMPKPLTLRSNRYSRIRLRALTVADMDFLGHLYAQRLPAREFCVSLVHRQLASPNLQADEVRSWPNRLLLRAALAWSVSELGLRPNDAEEPSLDFVSVVAAYEALLARHKEEMCAVSKAAAWLASEKVQTQALTKAFAMAEAVKGSRAYAITEALDRSKVAALMNASSAVGRRISAVTNAIHKQAAVFDKVSLLSRASERLFPNLPDFSRLIAAGEKAERGRNALVETGYGFAVHLFPFLQLAKVTRHDERVKHAGITNEFCAMTRDREFRPMVQETFLKSSILKPRWAIIEQGLLAHQERRYALSVPVFLAQLEGIFADALILKAVAVKKRGRIYARDSQGNVKLDKWGREVELGGLQKKVEHSPFRTDERLGALASAIVGDFAGQRNDILHGRTNNYARAKLSTQLIFAIYVLAREMEEFEKVGSKRRAKKPATQGH